MDMIPQKRLKPYDKKLEYSYCLGTYPTFELLREKPECVEQVLIHSKLKAEIRGKLEAVCIGSDIPLIEHDTMVERLGIKENCLVIGVFHKFQQELSKEENHIVLVHPGDAGNLGTILRSCVGFGIRNLAIIEPAVDVFQPKVIRASMGAVFHMRFSIMKDFAAYKQLYGSGRELYPFMLKGEYRLGQGNWLKKTDQPFSLIFGNEATGLDDSYLKVGRSVWIAQTDAIDSLNLSLAAGIGLYEFTKQAMEKSGKDSFRDG